MPETIQIRIYDRFQLVFSEEFDRAVELGRQSSGDVGIYSRRMVEDHWRVIVAGHDENTVSRNHAMIVPSAGGKVVLTNLSTKIPVRLSNGDLSPRGSREVSLPAVLTLGHKTIRVQEAEPEGPALNQLAEATMPPGRTLAGGPASEYRSIGLRELKEKEYDQETVLLLIQGAMDVFQSAATDSEGFFQKAARGVVDLVGLDTGRVLLIDPEGVWKEKASATAPHAFNGNGSWKPSQRVLDRVSRDKRTYWQSPDGGKLDESSLAGLNAVVAAPILDPLGQVIGALYGDRKRDPSGLDHDPPINKHEAKFVELLAMGVAAGLARLQMEQTKVRFEQFFTPELTAELAANPDLLSGRDSEVTILFCDIRGFSRVSGRLGPAGTVDWIGDVMNTLSDCVREHQGVLVDYIGDELMAMWGAPKAEPDQARLACRAALAMIGKVARLNEKWRDVLGEDMDLGVGVNTGIARVGNTGSKHKFKYGPLGETVNLASRIQGATKFLKTRLLVTGATREKLGDEFHCRRIGKIEVVNIQEPVQLYELAPEDHADWSNWRDSYESALSCFEEKKFHDAARTLGELFTRAQGDGPSLVLLHRSVNYLIEEPADFNPVWKLPGK